MDQKKDKEFCELGVQSEMNCFYFGCPRLEKCKTRMELYHGERKTG